MKKKKELRNAGIQKNISTVRCGAYKHNLGYSILYKSKVNFKKINK